MFQLIDHHEMKYHRIVLHAVTRANKDERSRERLETQVRGICMLQEARLHIQVSQNLHNGSHESLRA